jgi:hypothetical protein
VTLTQTHAFDLKHGVNTSGLMDRVDLFSVMSMRSSVLHTGCLPAAGE